MIGNFDVRLWHITNILTVCSKADISSAFPLCPLLTQSGHSCLGLFGRKVRSLSAGADIYFPLYVAPLRRAAQSADQLLEGIGVFGGVLEPGQEVEWLSKFSAVMQTSRYGRQVFHTNSNVPRLLLEDGSAFILR